MIACSATAPDPRMAFKHRVCLNALIGLKGISRIIRFPVISRKICKGRVKRNASQKASKECACNTCTPCEGLAAPSTPLAVTPDMTCTARRT